MNEITSTVYISIGLTRWINWSGSQTCALFQAYVLLDFNGNKPCYLLRLDTRPPIHLDLERRSFLCYSVISPTSVPTLQHRASCSRRISIPSTDSFTLVPTPYSTD